MSYLLLCWLSSYWSSTLQKCQWHSNSTSANPPWKERLCIYFLGLYAQMWGSAKSRSDAWEKLLVVISTLSLTSSNRILPGNIYAPPKCLHSTFLCCWHSHMTKMWVLGAIKLLILKERRKMGASHL